MSDDYDKLPVFLDADGAPLPDDGLYMNEWAQLLSERVGREVVVSPTMLNEDTFQPYRSVRIDKREVARFSPEWAEDMHAVYGAGFEIICLEMLVEDIQETLGDVGEG